MSDSRKNPCVSCGACCASFRVQFQRHEDVPVELIEDLNAASPCLKGTTAKHRPKCVGLVGRIGVDAKCGVYPLRPTPCRAFTASFADGKHHPRCDEARAKHGLRPLKPSDWDRTSDADLRRAVEPDSISS